MDIAPADDGKPTMTRCPHCGAQNRDGAAFCSLCLARFGTTEEPQEVEAEPQEPMTVETSGGEQAACDSPVARTSSATVDALRQETQAWDEAANAFASPGLSTGDEIPAALADLPPELQMELIRPSSDFSMRQRWMRLAIFGALAIVAITMSIGILAMMINQRINKSTDQQQPQQGQSAPQAQTPVQTQPAPAPAPAPSGPESHPDLSFVVPSGWSSGGSVDSIVLSGPSGASIDIKSWERNPDGRYNFANGPLSATTESGAASEISRQLLQSLYGGSTPATATTSPASVGSVGGSMAELRGGQDGTYKQAYGFAHGNWAYMVLGRVSADRESELKSAMQAFIGSVTFKQ